MTSKLFGAALAATIATGATQATAENTFIGNLLDISGFASGGDSLTFVIPSVEREYQFGQFFVSAGISGFGGFENFANVHADWHGNVALGYEIAPNTLVGTEIFFSDSYFSLNDEINIFAQHHADSGDVGFSGDFYDDGYFYGSLYGRYHISETTSIRTFINGSSSSGIHGIHTAVDHSNGPLDLTGFFSFDPNNSDYNQIGFRGRYNMNSGYDLIGGGFSFLDGGPIGGFLYAGAGFQVGAGTSIDASVGTYFGDADAPVMFSLRVRSEVGERRNLNIVHQNLLMEDYWVGFGKL